LELAKEVCSKIAEPVNAPTLARKLLKFA
jgi:hypothetical protein